MATNWTIEMTPNVLDKLVDIKATRTGETARTYYQRGVPAGCVTEEFEQIIAARLVCQHTEAMEREAEGVQLVEWSSSLAAKLNAMES